MNKILFVTQNANNAIWIVDKSIKEELWKMKHNFVFFELREKWEQRYEIILNYIINIIYICFKSISYKSIYFSWENPYVIFIKFFYPWKKIYMCVHHVENYWWKTLIWKLILKTVYKIVVVSNFTKEQLIDIWVKNNNIIINYNWISKKFYPEKKHLFQKFKYILYVWTELERKNIKNLLLAYKQVVNIHREIKLIKIWRPIEWKEITDLLVQQLELKDNIIFKREYITDDELRRYYSNALCYVSVAKLEWFWLTIPESLSCWCPVVASNIGPFKEILWNSQIIVDPLNINKISEWILKYIENEDLRKKMSIEWIKIAKKFNWWRNVKKLKELFE